MNKQELQVRRPKTTLLGTSGIALARLVATSAAAGRTFATLIVATIIALMGTLTAEAQTASASSVNSDRTGNNAAAAIDGDTSTRWESNYSDPQWWQVDFGEDTPKTFNTITIEWEGASAKDFQLLATNNATVAAQTTTDASKWTVLTTVTEQATQAGHTKQTFNYGDTQTYRYVRFYGTKRATEYGYSFYEIKFYTIGLNSLTSNRAQTYVGGSVQLTPWVADASGTETKATPADFDYTVSPATMGTVDPATGIFTSAAAGTATISATPKSGTGRVGAATTKVTVLANVPLTHTRGIVDDGVDGWKVANVPAAYSDNLTQYYTSADDPRIENAGGVRQKTHVTEHYIYAKPGETIYLEPYTDFYLSDRTQYMDKAVRWYDYRTDAAHDWLTMYYSDSHTRLYEWGYIGGTALSGTRQSVSVATLTIPEDADIATKPVIIAMDASQSATSGKMNKTTYWNEPLINFRHLFIITDSREHVAEYSNSKEANEKFTRERKRFITARAGVNFQVRLNYIMPTATDYGSGMLYEMNDDDGTGHGTNARVGQAYIKTFDAQGNDKGEMFELGNSTKAFEGTAANKNFYRTITCTSGNAEPGVYTVRLYAKDTEGNNVYVRGTTNVPLIIQEYEITFVDNTKASFYTEAEMETHKNEIAHQQYDYLKALRQTRGRGQLRRVHAHRCQSGEQHHKHGQDLQVARRLEGQQLLLRLQGTLRLQHVCAGNPQQRDTLSCRCRLLACHQQLPRQSRLQRQWHQERPLRPQVLRDSG